VFSFRDRETLWAVALGVFGSIALWSYLSRPAIDVRSSLRNLDKPLAVGEVATVGSSSAPVVLVEFGDLECPFCQEFARDVFPDIQARYVSKGFLALQFRHFPLSMHPRSRALAEAAECAQARDGSDWLLSPTFESISRESGIDPSTQRACDLDKAVRLVNADIREGTRYGVDSTPTFFVAFRDRAGLLRIVDAFSGLRSVRDLQAFITRAAGCLQHERDNPCVPRLD